MNRIIEWFSDPGHAAFAAFAVSVAAIVVSVWAMVISRRTHKRTIEIEETRERDRIQEGATANLVADIQRGDDAWRLEVENRGQAEAREITVLLDGQPILDHPGVAPATQRGLNKELRRLPAGAHFRYVLGITLGCGPPWELEITWTDDSGEQGAYRTTLTF